MSPSAAPTTPRPPVQIPAGRAAAPEVALATRDSTGTAAAQGAAPKARPSEERVLLVLLFLVAALLVTVAWMAALVLGARWLLGVIF